ncbi:hypothetical protein SEA_CHISANAKITSUNE_85 [Gordonia phage ChisanaKitsune]|uniref:Uncharacterized protein n=1 Tax=Gordonia phage ChisanaKitsune TaxID=2871538 RepID=A0AAE7XF31_9CAUD|nr:hypothetical protein PQD15_gp085 [Gordonia phage ChisanaKitsune]QZE10850.1 hypothetical protein SEA_CHISANAKITSUNE_85 [Gordonia phage ChisanaKitsune]
MQIMCSRGCGYPINVPMSVMSEAEKSGVPVNVSHQPGQCPGEGKAPRYEYRLRVVVERTTNTELGGKPGAPIVLAKSGAKVAAESLSDAFDTLSEKLTEQWNRVGEMRYIAEQNVEGDDTPTDQE